MSGCRMADEDKGADPRIYLAAERTCLAWLRTGVALMAFGFVVARFAVFLRELALPRGSAGQPDTRVSLYLGLGLILAGVIVCIGSAVRHARYVRAIDEGRFRAAFGSVLVAGVVVLLTIVGVTMALFLVRL